MRLQLVRLSIQSEAKIQRRPIILPLFIYLTYSTRYTKMASSFSK